MGERGPATRLVDKVAVVTGAGRGIGRAVAARFAAEGASVVVNDVDATRGEEAASEITGVGGEAASVCADVSDEDAVVELFDQASSRYGGVDVLVNNAVCAASHIVDDDWQPTIDVVLKGTRSCSMAALEAMRTRRGGSIVNVASVNGLIGLQGIHVYSAAKGGVIAMTRSMAVEHGKDAIRVNAICPGTIRTEVWDPILQEQPDLMRQYADLYPLGRVGSPADVANCALFLASDEASWITGAVITVDGGLTAGRADFLL